MTDLFFYIDEAKKRSGVTSDAKLSEMLGLGRNAVNFYRKKNVLPTDETMIRLARVAGIDEQKALLDLCVMRTTGSAQSVWKKLAERVTHAALILFMLGTVSLPAAAAEVSHDNTDTVYYGKYGVIFKRGGSEVFQVR